MKIRRAKASDAARCAKISFVRSAEELKKLLREKSAAPVDTPSPAEIKRPVQRRETAAPPPGPEDEEKLFNEAMQGVMPISGDTMIAVPLHIKAGS